MTPTVHEKVPLIRFSMVIPCYNEAGNIPLILGRFQQTLVRTDAELILVDNGSRDGTRSVLRDLLPKFPFARAVHVDDNRGYGYGVVAGLRNSRGEFLGWTHGDMQTDPHDAIRAFEIIERARCPGRSYVKGSRRGRPLADAVLTAGMSLFETVYLGVPLNDINAQPNLFHRSFFEKWVDPPHDFSLDLYALHMARRLNCEVIRFPVLFRRRVHGHSYWDWGLSSKWRFIMKTLAYSAELRRRSRGL